MFGLGNGWAIICRCPSNRVLVQINLRHVRKESQKRNIHNRIKTHTRPNLHPRRHTNSRRPLPANRPQLNPPSRQPAQNDNPNTTHNLRQAVPTVPDELFLYYFLICPLPKTTYFVVVKCCALMGPLA